MWYNTFEKDVNIYSNDPYYKNEDMKKMDFDYARYVTLMNEFSNTCGKIRTFRDPEIKDRSCRFVNFCA